MTPDEYTNRELMLEVGDGHRLYVHDWGKADAKAPILFLHGGPGGQCRDSHKELFDPTRQRVIFHDQRGGGRSLPYGSRRLNTTDNLVADISKIADELGIRRFVLTGRSWGSTLALAYVLTEPLRVDALVLGGIFTASQPEIDWIDQGGFRPFFPEVWENYLAATPEKHRDDPSAYHHKRAQVADAEIAKASAYAYHNLESGVSKLDDRPAGESYETFEPTSTQLEMYYLSKRCFLKNNYLLDNARYIDTPVWLVQGRYDMVCPPQTALELHRRLPRSELVWTTSGHRTEREDWKVMRTILLQLTSAP